MKKVKLFWNKRAALRDLPSGQVTHKDVWQHWLEIQTIGRYLRKSDRVLDVGCGNGFSTRIFLSLVKEIIGIDFSEEMISRAKEETKQDSFPGKAPTFYQHDVLNLLPSFLGYFSVVISERCLINLANFEDQKRAITNIASVLKLGGRFIFVEGSAEGRSRLNEIRKKAGLPKMPPVWHNIDFHERETLKFLQKNFILEDRIYFGMYDFLSRVVHPLLVDPEEPRYDARINEIAAKLSLQVEGFEDLSRVLFLVLRKK